MKLLTGQPAVLAKISDLVDRDVESTVEVHQEALFPLGLMPSPLRVAVAFGATVVQAESCCFTVFQQVTNAGAAAVSTLFLLKRGLWRLRFDVFYTCSVLDFAGTGTRGILIVQPGSQVVELYATLPIVGTQVLHVERLITLDDDRTTLEIRLGTIPAAQTHNHFTGISLEKLI